MTCKTSIRKKIVKVTGVRIWHENDQIVGFERFYDNLSTGATIGSEFKTPLFTDISLEATEYFTRIEGSYNKYIHSLTFHTTKGRVISVGERRGFKTFDLKTKHNNKIIRYFVV